ncbi:hypothetical protein ACNR9Q_15030 [Maribacter sp. X9]|uniref:hypothetical protein n=1 Tax=Maribacter sp. X9 TaxID=3402159 RepID=UPI003AF3B9B0
MNYKTIFTQNIFFLITVGVFSFCSVLYSQGDKFKDWLPEEIEYYKNLEKLAEYVQDKPDTIFDISKDSVIQKFLFINEASKDSIYDNTVYSIEYKNGLFNTYFIKAISKHGLQNLDAKPLRFYNKTDAIYRPFRKSLHDISPFIMVYYLKQSPHKPLGTLAFDPKTKKLTSWILLNQGDSAWYYL